MPNSIYRFVSRFALRYRIEYLRWVTYIIAGKMMYVRLGKHRIVFELALAERGSVASDNHQLCFARTESLQSRLVSQCDCES